MKNKLVFAGLLIGVLAIIFTAGCATDPNAPPPYQFDGTSWTKTEEYELRFANSKWEVWCGNERILNSKQGDYKVEDNTLTFGDDNWSQYWGSAAGVWTLKSGTLSSRQLSSFKDNKGETTALDGTTWTRTAVLEMRFENGVMSVYDGANSLTYIAASSWKYAGNPYTVTSKNIGIRFNEGTARGTYVVDGNTLTVKHGTQGNVFDATRLQGTPWTKM